MSDAGFAAFRHRTSYDAATGRDRWLAPRLQRWITDVVRGAIAAAHRKAVLDVGCGEQPFRPVIEGCGGRYTSLDVVQNSTQSVDILDSVERVAAPADPFDVVLCTEVLHHVRDIDAAFAGLRRLVSAGGCVVATVPFMFPLHMEPYDFRRLTAYGLDALADAHGFRVETAVRLGEATDLLATLLSDVSILPTSRSLYSRLKVRMARWSIAAVIRLLEARLLRSNIAIASNGYLTTGVVLRAQ
jgi:SAM-dependent methyltransferase